MSDLPPNEPADAGGASQWQPIVTDAVLSRPPAPGPPGNISADGYIAYDDGQIGSLFDWMSGGDVEWKLSESDEHAMRSTQASKDFMQSVYSNIGAVILGAEHVRSDERLEWRHAPALRRRTLIMDTTNRQDVRPSGS